MHKIRGEHSRHGDERQRRQRRRGGRQGPQRPGKVRPLQRRIQQFMLAADPAEIDGSPAVQGLEPQ